MDIREFNKKLEEGQESVLKPFKYTSARHKRRKEVPVLRIIGQVKSREDVEKLERDYDFIVYVSDENRYYSVYDLAGRKVISSEGSLEGYEFS